MLGQMHTACYIGRSRSQGRRRLGPAAWLLSSLLLLVLSVAGCHASPADCDPQVASTTHLRGSSGVPSAAPHGQRRRHHNELQQQQHAPARHDPRDTLAATAGPSRRALRQQAAAAPAANTTTTPPTVDSSLFAAADPGAPPDYCLRLGLPDGASAYGSDCTRFVMCSSAGLIASTFNCAPCPGGSLCGGKASLVFNPAIGLCDW